MDSFVSKKRKFSDLMEELGRNIHPIEMKTMTYKRYKNDVKKNMDFFMQAILPFIVSVLENGSLSCIQEIPRSNIFFFEQEVQDFIKPKLDELKQQYNLSYLFVSILKMIEKSSEMVIICRAFPNLENLNMSPYQKDYDACLAEAQENVENFLTESSTNHFNSKIMDVEGEIRRYKSGFVDIYHSKVFAMTLFAEVWNSKAVAVKKKKSELLKVFVLSRNLKECYNTDLLPNMFLGFQFPFQSPSRDSSVCTLEDLKARIKDTTYIEKIIETNNEIFHYINSDQ